MSSLEKPEQNHDRESKFPALQKRRVLNG